MLNILSWIFGIIGLIIVIPSTIPLLGWGNWLAMPFIVLGIILGFLSSSTSGRTFCIIILVISAIRLFLGGGIL